MVTVILVGALVVLVVFTAVAVWLGGWSGTWAGSGMPPDGRYFARDGRPPDIGW